MHTNTELILRQYTKLTLPVEVCDGIAVRQATPSSLCESSANRVVMGLPDEQQSHCRLLRGVYVEGFGKNETNDLGKSTVVFIGEGL